MADSLFVVIVSTSARVKAPHRGDQSSVQSAFTSRRRSLHSMTKGKKKHGCPFYRLDLRVPTGVKTKGRFLGVPILRKDQTKGDYRPKTKKKNFPPVSWFFAVKPSEHRGEMLKNAVRTEDLSVFKAKAQIVWLSQRIRRTAQFTLMPESCFRGTLF